MLAGKPSCGGGLASRAPAPRPGKGKCCRSQAEGGLWLSPSGWHMHAPGLSPAAAKNKSPRHNTAATWETPSKQINETACPRSLSHHWGDQQTNLWSMAARGRGVRIIRFRTCMPYCNKHHRPPPSYQLTTTKRKQDAPPGHTARSHCTSLDGDASGMGLLVRNSQRGTSAHRPHTCARTVAVREATPVLFRPYWKYLSRYIF